MRRLLHALALRLGTPVYVIEANMPAHELQDWILYFQAERDAEDQPSMEDVGPEQFALAMGADVTGVNSDGIQSGPPANPA